MASLDVKEEMTLAEKLKILDKVTDTVNNKAGKTVVGRLNNKDILDKLTIKYIPTPSENINTALGGGFPIGRMSILSGLPDSGKTSLALETIGELIKC